MSTVGEKFELVFNEYFNNQQKYKHKIELLKSINNEWNSQNLNNLFNNVSITQIMIEICKSLQINLNFLIGIEDNMFLKNSKDKYMNESKLKDNLIYKPLLIKQSEFLTIKKENKVLKFQTNYINQFFLNNKKHIVILKSGLVGIVYISQHYSSEKLFIKFDINSNDFFEIKKKELEVVAEEIIND
ncbi:MAG: hypothetical protein AB7V77_05225 [Candidatus Woesearchaeota archaeon]